MTAFRGSRAGAALAVLSVHIFFSTGASAAEADAATLPMTPAMLAQAPKRLLPRKPPEAAPAQPDEPAQPALPESPAADNPFARPRTGIEVNPLSGPHPEEIGTVDAASGGFARDIWDGTPKGLVARLIGQVPDEIHSHTVRDLLRRLLLTAAVPPARGVDEPDVALVPLRASKLQAIGLLGAAAELAELSPQRGSNEALLRLRAQNLLLRGDNAAVCSETRRPGIPLAKRYWQTLLIFCHIADGNIPEASFGASLLAESGEPVDPTFMTLVDRFVAGGDAPIKHFGTPSALNLAMLRQADRAFPPTKLGEVPPPLLAAIATDPKGDHDLRLQAAERAVRLGAMTVARLRSIYAAVPFSGEELNNALSTATAVQSPRSRALLYQAAAAHTVAAARAEILQKALATGRQDGAYALSIAVYQPMLETLASSAALAWFAGDAARALYSLGQVERARSWLQELRYEAVRDPAAAQTMNALWALRAIASAPETPDVTFGTMTAWRGALKESSPETSTVRLATANALFEIQGIPVDRDGWRDLLDGYDTYSARMPGFAYRAALKAAADAGRLGETLLLVSIIAGREPLAEIDLNVLADVTGALQLVGLGEEARALVLEVAVERGI